MAETAKAKLDALRLAEAAFGDECSATAYQVKRDSIVLTLSIAEYAPQLAALQVQAEAGES